MERVVFLDPEALKSLETERLAPADPNLIRVVNAAREKLPDRLDQLIHQRVYEGMRLTEMAQANGLTVPQVRAGLYEAERLLRIYLAGFAFKRWGIKTQSCRLCGHPKAGEIDRLLRLKSNTESWGAFGRRLEKAIGEKIQPPSILIAHSRHSKIASWQGGGSDVG